METAQNGDLITTSASDGPRLSSKQEFLVSWTISCQQDQC